MALARRVGTTTAVFAAEAEPVDETSVRISFSIPWRTICGRGSKTRCGRESERCLRGSVSLFICGRASYNTASKIHYQQERKLFTHLKIVGRCRRTTVTTPGYVQRLDTLVHRRLQMTPFHLFNMGPNLDS